MISVAVLDDNRLVREGTASLLGRLADICVVATEADGPKSLLGIVPPDVILVDLGLDQSCGMTAVRRLMGRFPDAGIIIMDLLSTHEEVLGLIGAGVSGFVLKEAPLEVFARTIRSVAAGVAVLPIALTGALFSNITREARSKGGEEDPGLVRVTGREREVIELLQEGLSNKAIGKRLDISIHTVKTHLRNLLKKLDLRSRLQIAAYANAGGALAPLLPPAGGVCHPEPAL